MNVSSADNLNKLEKKQIKFEPNLVIYLYYFDYSFKSGLMKIQTKMFLFLLLLLFIAIKNFNVKILLQLEKL